MQLRAADAGVLLDIHNPDSTNDIATGRLPVKLE